MVSVVKSDVILYEKDKAMKSTRSMFDILSVMAIVFSMSQAGLLARANEPLFLESHKTFSSYNDVGYDQVLRPQFHFTSRKNWLNDANGMVYYDGEWHLYFQHCALGVNRGPKSWGHAVSADMVHWTQLPHAILPYDKGAIWSGTAVVDHNNSLGKQIGDTKTIVAYFTTTWKEGFFQAMAYSTDRGRPIDSIMKEMPLFPIRAL
jgi:fructan beta-fructosidase